MWFVFVQNATLMLIESRDGLIWNVKSSDVYPNNGKPYVINEKNMLPLYACTPEELTAKFRVANVAFTTQTGGTIKVLKDVPVRRFYEIFIRRNSSGTPLPAPKQWTGAGVEEVFHFELTNSTTNPTLSKWASMAYVPSLNSLPETADIVVAEVFRYTWAVYLVIKDITLVPTYFPVDNREVIDLKVEWDYNTITSERPAVINRGTAMLEPEFLMNRSRSDGSYYNGVDEYILHMNRSVS